MLARDVVSAKRQRPERRTSQHRFAPIDVHEVIQIGEPASKLPRRRVDREREPLFGEIRASCGPILRNALRGHT